jgi:hypothetical protein
MSKKVFLVGLSVLACFVVAMFSQAGILVSTAQLDVVPNAKDPLVKPDPGNYSDTYTYSISVNYSKEVMVRLLVWDVTTNVFEPRDAKWYTENSAWEPLNWSNITYTEKFEGEHLSFKFEWYKESSAEWRPLKACTGIKCKEVFSGPAINLNMTTIEVRFDNADVNPKNNINCTGNVSYNVYINASGEAIIALEVYDPIKDWRQTGKSKTYTNIGSPKNISWTLKPFEDLKFCGDLDTQYRFKASNVKGELVNSSAIYNGPKVFGATLENPTVTPPEGNYNDNFTYQVEVSNVTEGDINNIYLETRNPCTKERKDIGTATTSYKTKKAGTWILNWTDKAPFNASECGSMAAYRFIYGHSYWPEDGWEEGPDLLPIPPIKNCTVEPKEIGYRFDVGSVTPINITALVNTSRKIDIELFIIDPVTNVSVSKGVKECSKSGNLTWMSVTPFVSIPEDDVKRYLGKRFNLSFRYDGWTEEYEGPEFVVAFDNPNYPHEVRYGNPFDFSVDVIASRNLSIKLKYRYNGIWTTQGINNSETPNYIKEGNWQTLTWNCTAYYSWDAFKFEWRNESNTTLNELSFYRALEKDRNSIIKKSIK